MANPFPPNVPPLNLVPVRTPMPIRDSLLYVRDSRDWEKFFTLLFNAVTFILQEPIQLSGLDASKPLATLYPQNSLFFATDTLKLYLCNYATPGQPSTAVWLQIVQETLTRTPVADAGYNAQTTDQIIAYTAITASRAVTLPAAVTTMTGKILIVKDESGNASNVNTITAVGTVDGAINPTLINAAYGVKRIYSNGTTWFSF